MRNRGMVFRSTQGVIIGILFLGILGTLAVLMSVALHARAWLVLLPSILLWIHKTWRSVNLRIEVLPSGLIKIYHGRRMIRTVNRDQIRKVIHKQRPLGARTDLLFGRFGGEIGLVMDDGRCILLPDTLDGVDRFLELVGEGKASSQASSAT